MEDKKIVNDERPLSLSARVARISSEVGPIAKNGQNIEQKYNFIESSEVSAQIRRLHNEYGIAIFPEIESYAVDEVVNYKGKVGYHYLLNMRFKVVNTDDQSDFFEQKWLGESTDWGDKGINKAATAGEKYFLMKLYHISEKGDDPDLNTPQQFKGVNDTSAKLPPIDYKQLAVIRGKLPLMRTDEALDAYWKSLTVDKRHRSLLVKDFKKRRGEIHDKSKEEHNDQTSN